MSNKDPMDHVVKPLVTQVRKAQIDMAIELAIRMESKITPLALAVPMLGSLRIRHLLNNLGAISINFLDVGSHVGGSYCSAVFKNNNLDNAFAIDSWASDATEGHHHEQDFRENAAFCTPANVEKPTIMAIIKSECFEVDLTQFDDIKIDFYSYDAGHSREQQKEALIYYKPILCDEFIYCCDDWTFEEVKEGTMEGIEAGGYEVLHQRELLNDTPGDGHLNDEWWRGYAVFLLKKKS